MLLQFLVLSIPKGLEWLALTVAVIFFCFWVKTIIEILKSQMPFITKLAWLLAVIFTGIVGLVVYKIWEMINYSKKVNEHKAVSPEL